MYTVEKFHRDVEQFFKPQSVRLPCRICRGQGRIINDSEVCGHEVYSEYECTACNGSGSVEAAV